jgi:hypothetical protein
MTLNSVTMVLSVVAPFFAVSEKTSMYNWGKMTVFESLKVVEEMTRVKQMRW